MGPSWFHLGCKMFYFWVDFGVGPIYAGVEPHPCLFWGFWAGLGACEFLFVLGIFGAVEAYVYWGGVGTRGNPSLISP